MRKVMVPIVFTVLMLFAICSTAYAGQFGSPEPTAKEGKVALGVGYFYYSAKSKPKDTENWDESKSSQNQAYVQLGYGFVKNWEAYLRVGGADIKSKDAFSTASPRAGFKSDFEDGYKPSGTLGVKGIFNISNSFGIGPFFQASLYSSYEDSASGTNSGFSETQTMKVKKQREINLGVGLQGKIGETIVYGGPVAYWARSKAEWTGKVTGAVYAATGTDTATLSTTYKEKGNIGGFAGIRIPLIKSLNLEVEGQLKSRFSMGGALTYSF
jgi:hypothetical protein